MKGLFHPWLCQHPLLPTISFLGQAEPWKTPKWSLLKTGKWRMANIQFEFCSCWLPISILSWIMSCSSSLNYLDVACSCSPWTINSHPGDFHSICLLRPMPFRSLTCWSITLMEFLFLGSFCLMSKGYHPCYRVSRLGFVCHWGGCSWDRCTTLNVNVSLYQIPLK